MKLVTPKEKLRYLIAEGLDIHSTITWFGFNNVINAKCFIVINVLIWLFRK